MLDTDGDGVLTSEEYAAGARSMFDKMDTDKDGYLEQGRVQERPRQAAAQTFDVVGQLVEQHPSRGLVRAR